MNKETFAGHKEFESVKREVINLLAQHNIPIKNWGKGSAKTMDHLIKEVMEGEALLEVDESGELIRRVTIIFVDIYYTDHSTGKRFKLVEEKQIFNDGRERRRKLEGSLAEKLKAGEIPNQDMVNRAIHEELGVTGNVIATEKEMKEVNQDSPSFPGLRMKAVEHFFEVELSDEMYKPNGYTEHQPDKNTYFKWIEV